MFQPDYRHFAEVMKNKRPARLPLYEHYINAPFMERLLGQKFAHLAGGNEADRDEYLRQIGRFFKTMTYDVISYEVCITDVLPGHGALLGGMPGPIQNRADFKAYPWADLPRIYTDYAFPFFDSLERTLPEGMKAVGGIGNGVFEISEDLVGMEYLPFMQVDDPELYADVFNGIGEMMFQIWSKFLARYKHNFVACRFGDDLGFKASLLTNPDTIRSQVLPQYKRVIDLIHSHGCPFLWHSCGCIFEIMEDVVALGIDAKHSTEDVNAPYDRWIRDYSSRIALVGGFDLGFLCQSDEATVYNTVLKEGARFRAACRGYALGSGNSIPDYVPVENYRAMCRAAQTIREQE
jgi:uroporphyrinogen decarboxylase